MSEYTLEIKQIVDYSRCRIYRQFVQALIADRSIRVSGDSGLFLSYSAPMPTFALRINALMVSATPSTPESGS